MILIYDVETTGLPDWKKPSNHPSQPHIIQIAAIKVDEDGKELERFNHFIKPDGWTLPEEITTLTGITQEKLEAEGIPIAEALIAFVKLFKQCKLSVAHNDSFDRRVLRIEMARIYGTHPILDEWKQFPAFCTMEKSCDIVKCPPTAKMIAAGFNKFKSPKLQESFKHFFDREPEKSHDAMADVESTLAIYLKLVEKKEEMVAA